MGKWSDLAKQPIDEGASEEPAGKWGSLAQSQVEQTPQEQEDLTWGQAGIGALKNIPTSMYKYASDIISTIAQSAGILIGYWRGVSDD